jgi:hypothetical protein
MLVIVFEYGYNFELHDSEKQSGRHCGFVTLVIGGKERTHDAPNQRTLVCLLSNQSILLTSALLSCLWTALLLIVVEHIDTPCVSFVIICGLSIIVLTKVFPKIAATLQVARERRHLLMTAALIAMTPSPFAHVPP